MACMVTGCQNAASNRLGLRLRKRNTRAVWAPDLEAYLCKEHAEDGGTWVIDYIPGATGNVVDITVTSSGKTITNRKRQVKKTAS